MFLPAPSASSEKVPAAAQELKSTVSADALGAELPTVADVAEDEGKAEGADIHSESPAAGGRGGGRHRGWGPLLERGRAVAVLQPERVWAGGSKSGFRVMRPALYLAGALRCWAQELVRSLF